jgi:hypothetical protein
MMDGLNLDREAKLQKKFTPECLAKIELPAPATMFSGSDRWPATVVRISGKTVIADIGDGREERFSLRKNGRLGKAGVELSHSARHCLGIGDRIKYVDPNY